MTLLLVDIALWQGNLKPADVWAAGFDGINLKISHGLTTRTVHPQASMWVTAARAAGKTISTFHFLDGTATGTEQAGYAYAQLQALGLTVGTAHQVDCESTATESIVRDYVVTMQGLLGRPVVLYTGDWWWAPRGWDISALTPYLWAAPNAGYLNAYPGDTSAHWQAGYGGWPVLSVMQYAVQPLLMPDGSTGSIDVSKSAVRDHTVWAALTGEGDVAWYLNPALTRFRNEVNTRWPNRDKTSDGTIGDLAHQSTSSDHNPDPAGQADAGSVDAWDMDVDGVDVQACIRAFEAHESSAYWIYNDQICFRTEGWKPRSYAYAGAGRNRHVKHVHFNTREAYENSTKPWGIREDDMPLDNTDKAYLTGTLVPAIVKALLGAPVKATGRNLDTALSDLFSGEQSTGSLIAPAGKTVRQHQLARIEELAKAIAGRVDVDTAEVQAIAAEVGKHVPTAQANAQAFLDSLNGQSTEEAARIIVAVLGQERARELGSALSSAQG